MIRLVVGNNVFLRHQILDAHTDQSTKILDGEDCTREELLDALFGQDLFSQSGVVIVRNLSKNATLWSEFSDLIDKKEVDCILVEDTLDKRTKTYKWLKKQATIDECAALTLRQHSQASAWCYEYAQNAGVSITKELCDDMVQRCVREEAGDTIIDQMLLASSIRQLAVIEGDITQTHLDTVLAPSQYENVFALLDYVFAGDQEGLRKFLTAMRATQDPYQLLGLLASQITTMYAVAVAQKTPREVAADLGVHPYGVEQLARKVREVHPHTAAECVLCIARVDENIKQGNAIDPWTEIEVALYRIMTHIKTPHKI